jgi:hypothetical protein
LIKNSLNHKLNFSNKLTASTAEIMANYSSNASLIFDKPFLTKKKNILTMDNYSLNLQPHEKKKIKINLKTEKPELVEEHFEIMVRDGQSAFFKLMSQVECPHVQLNRVVMNLGRIYAGVTEYINPQSKHQKASLVLKNYGNLPAIFKWKNINDPNRVVCQFEP